MPVQCTHGVCTGRPLGILSSSCASLYPLCTCKLASSYVSIQQCEIVFIIDTHQSSSRVSSTLVWFSPFLYSSGQSSSRMRGLLMRRRMRPGATTSCPRQGDQHESRRTEVCTAASIPAWKLRRLTAAAPDDLVLVNIRTRFTEFEILPARPRRHSGPPAAAAQT